MIISETDKISVLNKTKGSAFLQSLCFCAGRLSSGIADFSFPINPIIAALYG